MTISSNPGGGIGFRGSLRLDIFKINLEAPSLIKTLFNITKAFFFEKIEITVIKHKAISKKKLDFSK